MELLGVEPSGRSAAVGNVPIPASLAARATRLTVARSRRSMLSSAR